MEWEWTKRSFLRSIKSDEDVVPSEQPILFLDTLHAQTMDEFKWALVEECNTSVWPLQVGYTDEVQPIKCGLWSSPQGLG